MLMELAREIPLVDCVDLGTVGDSGAEIHGAITNAIEATACDIIVTSGGVSMGELDLIKPYIEHQGQVFFGRLNMKPGKPTTFGRIGNTLILGLPGNPVSCFVTASLFFETLVSTIATGSRKDKPSLKAQLLPKSVKVDPIRPEYHRCTIYRLAQDPNKLIAVSTGANLQQSSRLLSAANATGLAFLPAGNQNYECRGQTQVVLLEQLQNLPVLS